MQSCGFYFYNAVILGFFNPVVLRCHYFIIYNNFVFSRFSFDNSISPSEGKSFPPDAMTLNISCNLPEADLKKCWKLSAGGWKVSFMGCRTHTFHDVSVLGAKPGDPQVDSYSGFPFLSLWHQKNLSLPFGSATYHPCDLKQVFSSP